MGAPKKVEPTAARAASRPSDPRPPPGPPDRDAISRDLEAYRGRRVAVAMSGGVDSAVAALLLKRAGAEPIGLALRLHDPDPENPLAPKACCPPEDLQDARRVADVLDFPFYVLDAREPFESRVVRPFVDAYLEGRTPNPCVACNSFVKLERLARRAQALGCAALATGHYARLVKDEADRPHLFAGADRDKDQSYFLFGVEPAILGRLLFPIGAMGKAEVRRSAVEADLPVAHKLESQEVCFVGGRGAGAFVRRRAEALGAIRAGRIVDEEGAVLGSHPGVVHYTVGQRRGLGLARGRPLYVLAIDAAQDRITVGDPERLLKRGLLAESASWPAGTPDAAVSAVARIRYRHRGVACVVDPLGAGRVEVRFEEPVAAVAPGQAVVFYRGEEVLGGAWIKEAIA